MVCPMFQNIIVCAAKKDVEYTLSEKEIDGKIYQVLSGSFLLEPNDDNPSAIGERK